MISLAGFWDMGYNSPLREVELWKFMLRDFAGEKLHMVPVSGIRSSILCEHNTIEELLLAHADKAHVYVTESATSKLKDFVHPEDALYIFGRAGYDPIGHKKEGDLEVQIETNTNQGMLWPHQAAGIVLYDRLMKS